MRSSGGGPVGREGVGEIVEQPRWGRTVGVDEPDEVRGVIRPVNPCELMGRLLVALLDFVYQPLGLGR